MKLNKIAKIILISIMLTLVVGCDSSVQNHGKDIATIRFYPEDDDVRIKIKHSDVLKESFIEEVEANSKLDVEYSNNTLFILFDSLEYFNEWSNKYFDGDLIKYKKINNIFLRYEKIVINQELFYKNKYNIYEFTPREEGKIFEEFCDDFDVVAGTCTRNKIYLYELDSEVIFDSESSEYKEVNFEKSFEYFDIELINNTIRYDGTLDYELEKSTTFKYVKVKPASYIILFILSGIGIFFLYKLVSKLIKNHKKNRKKKVNNKPQPINEDKLIDNDKESLL